MSRLEPLSGNVIQLARPAKPSARRPEYLDLHRMRGRYGWIPGTFLVWRNRARARRELMALAQREPDSVLADAGMTRAAAAREARRWFWQDFRC